MAKAKLLQKRAADTFYVNDRVGPLRVDVERHEAASQITFTAFDKKVPVAVLTVNDFGDDEASVFKAKVREDRQKQGIGRALYLYAMGWLRDHGFKLLTSDASGAMTPASEGLWEALWRDYPVIKGRQANEPDYRMDLTSFRRL